MTGPPTIYATTHRHLVACLTSWVVVIEGEPDEVFADVDVSALGQHLAELIDRRIACAAINGGGAEHVAGASIAGVMP